MLKVLTFNAGLWRFDPLGVALFSPVKFFRERFNALSDAVNRCKADVVFLQEVCDQRERSLLVERVKANYPFYVVDGKINGDGITPHGLMIFSKKEIRSSAFIPFEENCWDETIFFRKGLLVAKMDVYGLGTVALVNTHLISGALRHSESAAVEAIRTRQIAQLFTSLNDWTFGTHIVGGDLNAGPQASARNYEEIRARLGVTETNGSASNLITLDPENPLIKLGPHRGCTPLHCDHVLVSERLRVVDKRVVFREHSILYRNGQRGPLSDHYGYEATVDWDF